MFGNVSRRGAARRVHWDFVRLDSGATFEAWCAGPLVTAYMHQRPRGAPCRKLATDNALGCQCCKDKIPATWRGFLPLWDDNGGRWYTVLSERYADLAESLTFCCPVRVTKMRERGSPLRAERSPRKVAALPIAIASRQPADLRPYLVTLWKDIELAAWFRDHPPDPDTVTEQLNEWRDGMKYRQGVPGCVVDNRPASSPATVQAGATRAIPELVGEVVGRLPALNGHAKKGGAK